MTRQSRNILVATGGCVIAFLVVALVLSGLFRNGDVNPNGEEADSIVVGAVLDLTGAAAPYGQWSKKGLDLALDDLRASGANVRLIIEDGQSDSKAAVSAFNKLTTVDKAPAVIMTTVSGSIMACAPIAERKQVLLFAPGSSSPAITTAGDYVFRNRISGTFEVEKAAEAAWNTLGLKRMALLVVNNEFGRSYGDAFRVAYTRAGGAIVHEDAFPQGGTDFRTQLAKLKGIDCDGVFLVGQVVECAYVLKQAKELEVSAHWLSTVGIENPKLIEIAGEAANGVVYTAPRYELDDEGTRNFEQEYFQRHNEHSQMYAANSYDALFLLVDAAKSRGASGKAMKEALYLVKDYPGVSGSTTFDSNGDVVKPVVLRVVRGGEFVPYKEED